MSIKVLTIVDPKTPLSKMHHVGASMLPYDLCKEISKSDEIEMSLLVDNDLHVEKLGNVRIVDLGKTGNRYQQELYKKLIPLVNDYDLIHCHVSTPGFVKYMTEFSPEVQRKFIFTLHTWTRSLAVSYYYVDYFKRLVNNSEVNLVFLTKAQMNWMLKSVGETEFYKPERVHIIYNAVNEDFLFSKDQSKVKDRVIAVGRLVESKGIDKIVSACIKCNKKLLLVSPEWRMTPKEEKYRNKVLDLIKDAPEGLIEFHNSVPHKELMTMIEESELGVLYSTFDVFSLFILECIYHMTPVLAYNCGSTSEVIEILGEAGVYGFDDYNEFTKLLSYSGYVSNNSKMNKNCYYSTFIINYLSLYKEVYGLNLG